MHTEHCGSDPERGKSQFTNENLYQYHSDNLHVYNEALLKQENQDRNCVSPEILTTVAMKIALFWVVMPCS
jgi:hypothetical protein